MTMTDLEKFIETYKQFGIQLDVEKKEDGTQEIMMSSSEEGYDGYSGFHSNILFTKEGEFIQQGFWE